MANRADDSDAKTGSTAITRSDRDLPSGSVDAGDEPGLLKRMRGKTKRSS